MIPVVRPYLPDKKKYEKLISKIFDSSHLTNQGRYLKELESRLSEYLNVDRLICVSSGSAALHLAYKIYGLKSKILTSPFSYVATSSTLVWDELIPDFIDIHPNSLNMHVDEEIFLKKANILSYGLEFEGHGKSDGLSGYIYDFDRLVSNFDTLYHFINNKLLWKCQYTLSTH